MSMLFHITHDLALVGEIADEVIVMRHGEIHCKVASLNKCCNNRRCVYCALLHCLSPQIFNDPTVLPITSDFMKQENGQWVEASSLSELNINSAHVVCLEMNRSF